MTLDLFRFIRLTLPTLCLFYSLSWSSLPALHNRHESFGSSDLYLDIDYEMPLSAGASLSSRQQFQGKLVSDASETLVQGTRVQIRQDVWYVFNMGKTRFIGALEKNSGACEPLLRYRIEGQDRILKRGVLKAGFCSPR